LRYLRGVLGALVLTAFILVLVIAFDYAVGWIAFAIDVLDSIGSSILGYSVKDMRYADVSTSVVQGVAFVAVFIVLMYIALHFLHVKSR
jgi:hypothetical protein